MLPQVSSPVFVVLVKAIGMVMRIIDKGKWAIIANLINAQWLAIILALAEVIPLVIGALVIVRFTDSDGIIAKRAMWRLHRHGVVVLGQHVELCRFLGNKFGRQILN